MVPAAKVSHSEDALIELEALHRCLQESPEYEVVGKRLRAALHQNDDYAAVRMGLGMILNAATCHHRLRLSDPRVPAPPSTVTPDSLRDDTLRVWESVLVVGYWPVFGAARDLLELLPGDRQVSGLMVQLWDLADRMAADSGGQNMVGELWGAMTGDRKQLAAFYTLPRSAALLADLVVGTLNIDWADDRQVKNLRVADFACGTGELLLQTHRSVLRRAGRSGSLGRVLVEDCLFGADVMPSSVHISASRLIGETWSDVPKQTNVWVMPYGVCDVVGGNEFRLGALDLIAAEQPLSLWADSSLVVTSSGERSDSDAFVADGSQHAVLMNPPYTRATNHKQSSAIIDDPAKIEDFVFLGGLGVDRVNAQEMSRKLSKVWQSLRGVTAGDGAAGLGSYFLDLGTRKLRVGGTLGIVLPISVVAGLGWAKTRRVLTESYEHVLIVSLHSTSRHGRSWSADTGMGEVMIVASGRKETNGHQRGRAGVTHCIIRRDGWESSDPGEVAAGLDGFPNNFDAAKMPGHTRVTEQAGGFDDSLRLGHPAGVWDEGLQRFAEAAVVGNLRKGELSTVWPVCELGDLGIVGPASRNLRRHSFDNGRGAFDCRWIEDRGEGWEKLGEYPGLWKHDCEWETRMEVPPDFHAVPSPSLPVEAAKQKIRRLWDGGAVEDAGGEENRLYAGATRLHINSDWAISSQPLAACLTSAKAFGGRSWQSFQPDVDRFGVFSSETIEKVICVWLNCTVGVVTRWYVSNRQGTRLRLTSSVVPQIPMLDLGELSAREIIGFAGIYDSLRRAELRPPTLLHTDRNRHKIDVAVSEVLGWDGRIPEFLRSEVGAAFAAEVTTPPIIV